MTRTKFALSLLAGTSALLAGGSTQTVAAEHPVRPHLTAHASPNQPVSFSLVLPVNNPDDLNALIAAQQDPASPQYRKWLTPAEFHKRFDLSDDKVKSIKDQLAASGFSVTQDTARHLRVSGTADAVERTFQTRVMTGNYKDGTHAVAVENGFTSPQYLKNLGISISGLHGVRFVHQGAVVAQPQNRFSQVGPYFFTDLKQAYHFPDYRALSGYGATIAILIDSDYNPSDMDSYFGHEGLQKPAISEVRVNGGANFSGTSGESLEATTDIQQAGGMAPNAHIIVYNVPNLNSDQTTAGLAQIVQDNYADVVSMSFNTPELALTAAYNGGVDISDDFGAFHALLAQGVAQGITFVNSSGDFGATPIPTVDCFQSGSTTCTGFALSAEYPATDVNVTGVGGTNLITAHSQDPKNLDSSYIAEQAFGNPIATDTLYGTSAKGEIWASGGGSSVYFPRPDYQKLVNTGDTQARTVPDLALHMGGCPSITGTTCYGIESSDVIFFNGNPGTVVGTSASAPDFAGLVALQVGALGGRFGNINPIIYRLAAAQNRGRGPAVFHKNIPGYNGYYTSGNNEYDRVVGNGTVDALQFLLLPNFPAAGVPSTPSNP